MKPFAILTFAIIAIIVLGLATALMVQFFPQENIFDKIRNGVEISQAPSSFGKTFYLGKIAIKKDLIITKTALNLQNYSLAVECNDQSKCCPLGEKCIKGIEWDYKKIKFKQDTSVQIYTRCESYFEEIVCRVYFGKKPAQAQIEEITHTNTGGRIDTIVKVSNKGAAELLLGENSLKVLKKVGENWEDTELVFTPKEINLILPNQKHNFVWETNLLTGGNYKLEFKFKALNAGHDTNSFELIVGENQFCFIDENKVETQDYNKTHIRVINFCNNCNYGYECLAQWLAKNDGNDYDVYTTNSTQFIREMNNGERCDRELDEETGYFSVQGSCLTGYKIHPVSDLTSGVCCIEDKTVNNLPPQCDTSPTLPECIIVDIPPIDTICEISPFVTSYSAGGVMNTCHRTMKQTIE
jgi:hypothetical protein